MLTHNQSANSCVQMPETLIHLGFRATTVGVIDNTQYWATLYPVAFFDGIAFVINSSYPDTLFHDGNFGSFCAFLTGFEYAGGVMMPY